MLALGLVAIATISACNDRQAFGPHDASALPKFESVNRGPDEALRGRVITTVRSLDGTAMLGQLVLRDTAEYVALFRDAQPLGDYVRSSNGELAAFEAVTSSKAAHRAGTFDSRTSTGGLKVRTTYNGRTPAELAEISKRGEVVAQIRSEWQAIAGGYRIARRTVTLYRDGRPSQSMLLEYDEPTRSPVEKNELIALQRVAVGSGVDPLAGPRYAMDGAYEGGDCNDKLDDLDKALGLYLAACVGLSACPFGGWACPLSMIAWNTARLNFLSACRKVDDCANAM